MFSLCRRLGIPFIHGAVAGFFGQAAVMRPQDRALWENTDTPDKGIELTTGNPPFIPPFIASVQAAEALKLVAACGQSPVGRLLLLDGLSMEWRSVKFSRDPGCPVCGAR